MPAALSLWYNSVDQSQSVVYTNINLSKLYHRTEICKYVFLLIIVLFHIEDRDF